MPLSLFCQATSSLEAKIKTNLFEWCVSLNKSPESSPKGRKMHKTSETVFSHVEPGVSPWSRGDITFQSMLAALSWSICTRVLTAHQMYLFSFVWSTVYTWAFVWNIEELSQVYTWSLFGEINSLSPWLPDLYLGVLIFTLPRFTPLMCHRLIVLLLSHGSGALLCESVLRSGLGTVEELANQRHLSNKKWWKWEISAFRLTVWGPYLSLTCNKINSIHY